MMVYAIKQVSTGKFRTKSRYFFFDSFGPATRIFGSTGQVRSTITRAIKRQNITTPSDYEIVGFELVELQGYIPHTAPKAKRKR